MSLRKLVALMLIVSIMMIYVTLMSAHYQPEGGAGTTQFRGGVLRTGTYDSPALREEPSLLWQFPMPRPVRMTPAVADGVVYIGGEDGRLYALDAGTGVARWRFDAGGSVVSSPAVSASSLYLGSLDNTFYALDTANGEELWRYETGGQIYSSPALVDDVLYFGSRDRSLYALSLDGELIWQAQTQGELWSTPAIAEGLVIIGGTDGMLNAFEVGDGSPAWATEIGSTRATPAIRDGVVFVGGGSNRVSAVDLGTGELLTTTELGSGGIEASAAVTPDGVYLIAMDGTLSRFTYSSLLPAFTLEWSINIGGPAYSSPSYADGVIHVVTEAGGLLYAFDARTGDALWRYMTGTEGDWRASSPVLVDGTLFIASNTQGMLALHGE